MIEFSDLHSTRDTKDMNSSLSSSGVFSFFIHLQLNMVLHTRVLVLETSSLQLHVLVHNPYIQKHYFEIQLIKFESEQLET
jgi:hypothetical protein